MSSFLNQSVVTPSELVRLDGLQTPIWIFDVDYMRMWWANSAAIRLWNADNLEALIDRDWGDYSDATYSRFCNYLSEFSQGKIITEPWTFYAKDGSTLSVVCTCSGIRIDSDRLAMLVEGTSRGIEDIDSNALCALNALDHTTAMISLYDLAGHSILQNAAAVNCYGNDQDCPTDVNPFMRRFVDSKVAYQIVEWVKSGQVFQLEAQVQTLHGIRWHTLDVRYTINPQTGQGLIVLNEQDITYQKQSDAEHQHLSLVLEEKCHKEQLLTRMTRHIYLDLDVPNIFQLMATEVRHAFDASRCNIFTYEEEPLKRCTLFAAHCVPEFPNYEHIEIPVTDTLFFHHLFSQFHPLASSNVLDEPLLKDIHRLCKNNGLKSLLIVQISYQGKIRGIITLEQCDRFREWNMDESKLLEDVAAQMGIALAQSNLLAQTSEQQKQLTEKSRYLDLMRNELEATSESLKKNQLQLIQTEKMSGLGQMVAGIVHEINNPISFIDGNLDHVRTYVEKLTQLVKLYQKTYPHPTPEIQTQLSAIDFRFLLSDLEKVIRSMTTGTERITGIVSSLRNFSRLDEGEKRGVDIHAGLDSTLIILQNRLRAVSNLPRVEVIKNYGDMPQVHCYAGQLNQVFMNLFANALDALENQRERGESAKIWITTKHIGAEALIEIQDNGPGISEHVKRRIFDPFFTTKPINKGTGLGLSISYQIITEKHGGTIECRSRTRGGTIFTIRIPIKAAVVSQPLPHPSIDGQLQTAP